MDQKELNDFVANLNDKKLTIAFAESVTAGKLCAEFSKGINVSSALKGSLVAYSEEIKQNLLKVDKETVDQFTAESQEVTREMAEGLKNLFEADIAVAITGLANPGGSETKEKPVGTIFLTIISKDKILDFRELFTGDHDKIIKQACSYTLQKLKQNLE